LKVLFLLWESLGGRFVVEALRKCGYEVDFFPFSKNEATSNKKQMTFAITEKIISGNYDYVFSFNFFSVAAIACKACNICYISWVYDNPCMDLYDVTISYETNRVFVFDSFECEKLNILGIKNVYYMPLAVEADFYDDIIKNCSDNSKYLCDIAFVGATKNENSDFLKRIDQLPDYVKGYLDAVINAQKAVYGYNFVEKIVTDDIYSEIDKVYPVTVPKTSFANPKWIFANYILCHKITGSERIDILSMLSEKYRVNLYTLEKTPDLPKVNNLGEINYYTEAPVAFNSAKINLNISLKSIVNGIPLRAMDIMGSGGFLLTNYQKDFLDYFSPGEDFVFYDSYEDLMAKVDYYLTHENERTEIAQNGLYKVRNYHSYEERIIKMFQLGNNLLTNCT